MTSSPTPTFYQPILSAIHKSIIVNSIAVLGTNEEPPAENNRVRTLDFNKWGDRGRRRNNGLFQMNEINNDIIVLMERIFVSNKKVNSNI